MNHSMAVTKQAGQDSGAVSDTSRTVRAPGGRQATGPDVYASPLQTVAAGILGSVPPMQFISSIDAANRALGNRAFIQWVGELQSGGRKAAVESLTLPKQGAPLQMMGKKKKKPGDAGAGPDKESVPELVAAQPQVPDPSPEVEPGPGVMPSQAGPREEAPVEKKKKKSRVQVALNTLRGEGVEAFGGYIEEEIGEAALLRTLVERINRAGDLGGVRFEALARVEARLYLLDPGGGAGETGAVASAQGLPPRSLLSQGLPQRSLSLRKQGAGGQEQEKAVCAPVKYGLSQREEELFDACVNGDYGRFKRRFRQVKVDVNIANNYGTLLINATYQGRVNIVKELLLRSDLDVNLATPLGATALYIAAQENYAEVAKLLLDHPGINVNLANKNGVTPLYIAAQKGSMEVVKLLLAAPGIKIDVRNREVATALHVAARNNFPGIVEQLVRWGADVNLTSYDGTTPLYKAVHYGYLEVARVLLQAPGTRVNQAIRERFFLLGAAVQQGHKDIVRLLLRKGADPNKKSSTGLTPLHVACGAGATAIVEMLLHFGADPDAEAREPGREGQGQTPYDMAEHGGHREVVSILKAHRRRRETVSSRLEQLSLTEAPAEDTRTAPPVPGTEVEEETDVATARV